MTSEQRSDPANGIWLCQNCGKLVDNDPIRFPAKTLRTWKADAERTALASVGKTAEHRETTTDKWVSIDYIKKAGIDQEIERQGFKLCWWGANEESERVDLDGWEYVVVEQKDGTRVRLKIHDHPAIGGYLVLLKKRTSSPPEPGARATLAVPAALAEPLETPASETEFVLAKLEGFIRAYSNQCHTQADLDRGPLLEVHTDRESIIGFVVFTRLNRRMNSIVPDPNARDGVRIRDIAQDRDRLVAIAAIRDVEPVAF